ncbi:MAG: succinylglutamate desuccinylase AstE [Idiomarinaceae bacterium HL-53]|nr:MAG: succinylglutamate desuccinylase AstE [Idiomarinaceae bacterium HL-53]CUS48698.1 succinylglutamate desuccinylase [Idiomarinaceae bacterium HL-53]
MLPAENFLAWTRANEWGGTPEYSEYLSNGVKLDVWDSGVLCVTPEHTNQRDLVLSCAVHGDETAPIEICDQLIEAIRSQELLPRCRILFLIANPAAINVNRRFVEENMNRLFNGGHSRGEGLVNKERIRAKKIEAYVAKFFAQAPSDEPRERLHYDMHTAIRDSQHEKFAVYPFTDGAPYKKRQLQLLRAMGVPVILLNDGPTTTFSYHSVKHHGADAFTVELGKVKPFGENDMQSFAATIHTLKALITEDEPDLAPFNENDFEIFQVLRSINRTVEDFELNFSDALANFTPFAKGELLARDGATEYRAEYEGEAVIFPNAKVALGQRALLTVITISANQLELV